MSVVAVLVHGQAEAVVADFRYECVRGERLSHAAVPRGLVRLNTVLKTGAFFRSRARWTAVCAVVVGSSAFGLFGGCASAQAPPANSLSSEELGAGWRLLFDGHTLNGWRGYRQEEHAGWSVVDGMIVRTGRGGDLITSETFANFELSLEWRVEEGGNSGVFYRAKLGLAQIYHSAPEMQVLDDERHADGRSPLTSAGANYGLHAAPRGVVKPAGEWNESRILVAGNHVEHWLNGRKVVEYELHSDDWKQRVASSKFVEWPEYGMAAEGHLGLQDHGDRVMFRNIKVRHVAADRSDPGD